MRFCKLRLAGPALADRLEGTIFSYFRNYEDVKVSAITLSGVSARALYLPDRIFQSG